MKYEIIALIAKESEEAIKSTLEYFNSCADTIKHIVFNNRKLDQKIGDIEECDILLIQVETGKKIVASDISIPCIRFLIYKVDSFVPFNAVSSWFNIDKESITNE